MKLKGFTVLLIVGVLLLTLIPVTGGFADSTVGKIFSEEASSNPAIPEEGGSDIAIPEDKYVFVDSEYAKTDDDGDIIVVAGASLSDLLECAPEGAFVEDTEGNELAEDKLPGSGMYLVMPDGEKILIIVYGDANSDGEIKSADARLALRRAVKLEDELYWRDKAIDVDGEEGILSADARLILRAAVKLETLG